MTSTIGATLLVVQLAHEMIVLALRGLVGAMDHRRDGLGLGGGGQDREPRTSLDVLGQALFRPELAGALQDEIDAKFAPRQARRIRLREHGDAATIDHERVLGRLHVLWVPTVDGVVLEKVGKVFGRDDVVHRHEIKLLDLGNDSEGGAADAAEPVDSDPWHLLPPSAVVNSSVGRCFRRGVWDPRPRHIRALRTIGSTPEGGTERA